MFMFSRRVARYHESYFFLACRCKQNQKLLNRGYVCQTYTIQGKQCILTLHKICLNQLKLKHYYNFRSGRRVTMVGKQTDI